MQDTMRSPLFRIIFAFGIEISLVILIAPTLSACLAKPMHVMGGFTLLFGISIIPLNYLYNSAFDQILLRLGKHQYKRSFGLRLLHALLFETAILLIAMPAVIYGLNFTFEQALTLNLAVAAVVPVYTITVNWAFDAY